MSRSLHEQYLQKLSEANTAALCFLSEEGKPELLNEYRRRMGEANLLAQMIAGDPTQGVFISFQGAASI